MVLMLSLGYFSSSPHNPHPHLHPFPLTPYPLVLATPIPPPLFLLPLLLLSRFSSLPVALAPPVPLLLPFPASPAFSPFPCMALAPLAFWECCTQIIPIAPFPSPPKALCHSWPETQEDLPDLLKPIRAELGNIKVVERYHHALILQHLYLRVFSEALNKTPTVLIIDNADKIDAASMTVLAALGQSDDLKYELPTWPMKVKSFSRRRGTAPGGGFRIQRSSNSKEGGGGKGIMGRIVDPFSRKTGMQRSSEEPKPMPFLRQSRLSLTTGSAKSWDGKLFHGSSNRNSTSRRSRGSETYVVPPALAHPPTPHPDAGSGAGRKGEGVAWDLPVAPEPQKQDEEEQLQVSDNQIDLRYLNEAKPQQSSPARTRSGSSHGKTSTASESELLWGTVYPITNAESIIIVSTCGPLQYVPMGSLPGANATLPTLKPGPHVSEITLPPLTEDEVAGLARVMLHCTSIDQPLLTFLVSKFQSPPPPKPPCPFSSATVSFPTALFSPPLLLSFSLCSLLSRTCMPPLLSYPLVPSPSLLSPLLPPFLSLFPDLHASRPVPSLATIPHSSRAAFVPCSGPWCADKSKGIPIVVRELCTYLVDNSQLSIDAEDMASLNRQSFDFTSFSCPSRDNIIRSMLDQLPARQAMVLKCASILGHRFRAHMLQQLLPQDMRLADMNSLIKLLQVLASGDFIESEEADPGVYKVREQLCVCVCACVCVCERERGGGQRQTDRQTETDTQRDRHRMQL